MKLPGVTSRGMVIVFLAALAGIGCGESDEGSEDTNSPSASDGNGAQNQKDGTAGRPDGANGSTATGGGNDATTTGGSTGFPGTGGTDEPAASGGSNESTARDASTPALDAGQGAGDAAPARDATTNDADATPDATSDASVSGQDSALPSAWPSGKYITPDEVHERLDAEDPDMLLVNVVDEEFYNLGHLPGSLKIPWDTLNDSLDQIDQDRHIVIYCRKGVRSESAYETLTSNGYSMIWVMEGGIEAWTAEGYSAVPD